MPSLNEYQSDPSHPTYDNIGEDPPPLTLDVSESCTVELPDSYTIAPFVDEYAGNVFISGINNASTISGIEKNDELWMAERHWLQHVNMVVKDNDGQLQETPVTYSGFFSHGQNSKDVRPRSTVGVFPILYEKSATMAMQKHSMHIAMKATEFVNPGQIPVLVGDCPLYALQKKCQWVYPDEVGESKLVCFMGMLQLLHVEMASQECVGKLLAGSGWDRMFSIAKVFTSGIAASLLGGKQIRPEKWIPRILESIKSGITQDFVSNRSPSIKNTNTDGGHIGFIANRPPEVAHKLLAMVS